MKEEQKRLTSEERNEMEKMISAGVMKQTDIPMEEIEMEDIVIEDVELNTDTPKFLQGELSTYFQSVSIEMNEEQEGLLQRSANMSTIISQTRREKKIKEEREEKKREKELEQGFEKKKDDDPFQMNTKQIQKGYRLKEIPQMKFYINQMKLFIHIL